MSQQESYIADKFCNYVANSLRWSPATKGLMLQLGDGINVVLPRIRSSSAWKWNFRGLAPIVARTSSLVLFHEQEGHVVSSRHAKSEFLDGVQELPLERIPVCCRNRMAGGDAVADTANQSPSVDGSSRMILLTRLLNVG